MAGKAMKDDEYRLPTGATKMGQSDSIKNRSNRSLITLIILFAVWAIPLNQAEQIDDNYCNLKVCKRTFKKPPLILISMDGFRQSYLSRNITPAIQRIIDCGTHSKFMLPTFPSKTFPNHYTIVTGLYPPWNGIVDNNFYDAELNKNFRKDTNDSGWYQGEPIWNTAKKNGDKAGVFFWPGSQGLVEGMRPDFWKPYDTNVPFTERIDTAIGWLNLPDSERPSLIQMYFEQPDASGHMAGPDSEQVRTAMITIDAMINYLTRRLLDEGLMGCVNMVVLSDHGMQRMNSSQAVIAENYMNSNYKDIFFTGAIARIQINESAHPAGFDRNEVVDNIIQPMSCMKGNYFLLYKKDLVPVRFHYSGNPRIGDVVIKGRPGVAVFLNEMQKQSYKNFGGHGFDNRIISMRAIFMAIGPDIIERQEIRAFQNIELYNLFADLLRVEPAPNNGTRGLLFNVLKNPPKFIESPIVTIEACTPSVVIKQCKSSTNCPLMASTYSNCRNSLNSLMNTVVDSNQQCTVSLCDARIYFDKMVEKTTMIEGLITKETWKPSKVDRATYVDGLSVQNHCVENTGDTNETIISLFINQEKYNTLDIGKFMVPHSFAVGTWQYLVEQTTKYLTKYPEMRFFAGPIYDQDGDGVRDDDQKIRLNSPSHIFFVLLKCENLGALWTMDECHRMKFIPYILPVNSRNMNCLTPEEYLYDNTARLRDIELLTGMEFFRNRRIWSAEEALQLRTLIIDKFW